MARIDQVMTREAIGPQRTARQGRFIASPLVHARVQGEMLELCQRGDRLVGQIAKDFDLMETAVVDW